MDKVCSDEKLGEFESALGYQFRQRHYLIQALTHRSCNRYESAKKKGDNERLEFLGDAVLKLVVSCHLYELYPDAAEGYLTSIRSYIISDQFLGKVAMQLNLGTYMQFSYGESQAGGRTRSSNLANALEALFGACYLDRGYNVAKAMILALFLPYRSEWQSRTLAMKDPKTQLQELMQKHKNPVPTYVLIDATGPEHNKAFSVKVEVELNTVHYTGTGSGVSKKSAEKMAAASVLDKINAATAS